MSLSHRSLRYQLTQSFSVYKTCTRRYSLEQLECRPMPNVIAALPNIGDGALGESSLIPFLVPRRKVWLTSTARVPI